MAQLKIIWTAFAKQQRDEIFHFWNIRNKSTLYSKKLRLLIKSRTNQLKDHPYSGKKIFATSYRILIFKNYSLVYFVDKEKVYIVAFWENHQDYEKLQNILGL